ncbi:MAG TPA: 30S ribosomal protein S1 [Desulfonatronum sp.]|nr:30S ribosomal protein S1 [Desulfonatronum sp.]
MEQSFAELFAASEMEPKPELRVGDRITGRVITVGEELVYVDTGAKIDAVVDKNELADKDGGFSLREGDEVELFVVSRQAGEVRLARTMSGEGGAEQLQDAMEGGIPVEGRIKETCKGGFRVSVQGKTAFCPLSQVNSRPVVDPEALVGETLLFLVTRIEERGRNIVVSRRALLDRDQAESLAAFMKQAKPGDIVQGTVTRLAPFGAFVEIAPGLEGLVHISELSWSRALAPEDVAAPGDTVTVKFLKMEDQGKGRVRIELSMKQALRDPWDEVSGKYQVGDIVQGTVTRLAPFGAFVEIAPGIEGLVHVSEMSYLKRVHRPEEVMTSGDNVPVMIKTIDLDARRIGLSMRDAEGDPWEGLAERYTKGQVVQGVLEKRESFGLFIRLEPGVVGLLPGSRLESGENEAVFKARSGDTIAVTIDVIDMDKRRISLALAEANHSEDWRGHSPQEKELGVLGAELQRAMRKKQ